MGEGDTNIAGGTVGDAQAQVFRARRKNAAIGCGVVILLLFVGGLFVKSKVTQMMYDPVNRATLAAKEQVETVLKAPSTAKFQIPEVLDHAGNHYLVRVVVDSQNGFGAMVRSTFLVIVELTVGGYRYKKQLSVQTFGAEPTETEIAVMKEANGWPTGASGK